MSFDWNRPYVELAAMEHYEALNRKIAALYGKRVKAAMQGPLVLHRENSRRGARRPTELGDYLTPGNKLPR